MNDYQYLKSLISEGEHEQQDFKYRVEDAAKLARSVSAFANTSGGRLLIGVRDDGFMKGVRSDEEIYMMHQAALRYCRPAATIRFNTYTVKGATIVVATISPSERKPIRVIEESDKLRAYVRIEDENIVASPVHVAIWRQERSMNGQLFSYTDDERQLMALLGECPQITLNQICRQMKPLPRQRLVMLLARLVRFSLVHMCYKDGQFLFSLC